MYGRVRPGRATREGQLRSFHCLSERQPGHAPRPRHKHTGLACTPQTPVSQGRVARSACVDPPAEMLLDCIWANPHDTERGIEQIVPPLGAAGHPVGGHEQALEEDEEVAIVGLFRGGSHLQRVTCLHHSEEGMIGSLVVVSEHPVDVVGAEAGEPKRPALGPEHLLGQSISGLDRAEGIGFPTNAILES